jgi:hypothetical protein
VRVQLDTLARQKIAVVDLVCRLAKRDLRNGLRDN